MTKEELARKKGMHIKEAPKSAAEALLSSPIIETKTEKKPEPVKEKSKVETKKEPKAVSQETPTAVSTPPVSVQKKDAPANDTQKKVGRPKGKPYLKVSFNLPEEYIDTVTLAAGIKAKGNISGYVVSLIEKDLKENEAIYEQIKHLKM